MNECEWEAQERAAGIMTSEEIDALPTRLQRRAAEVKNVQIRRQLEVQRTVPLKAMENYKLMSRLLRCFGNSNILNNRLFEEVAEFILTWRDPRPFHRKEFVLMLMHVMGQIGYTNPRLLEHLGKKYWNTAADLEECGKSRVELGRTSTSAFSVNIDEEKSLHHVGGKKWRETKNDEHEATTGAGGSSSSAGARVFGATAAASTFSSGLTRAEKRSNQARAWKHSVLFADCYTDRTELSRRAESWKSLSGKEICTVIRTYGRLGFRHDSLLRLVVKDILADDDKRVIGRALATGDMDNIAATKYDCADVATVCEAMLTTKRDRGNTEWWRTKEDFANLLQSLQVRLGDEMRKLRLADIATAAWVLGKAKVDREDLALSLWKLMVEDRLLREGEHPTEGSEQASAPRLLSSSEDEEQPLALADATRREQIEDEQGSMDQDSIKEESSCLLEVEAGSNCSHPSKVNVDEAAVMTIAERQSQEDLKNAPPREEGALTCTTTSISKNTSARTTETMTSQNTAFFTSEEKEDGYVFPEIRIADFEESFLLGKHDSETAKLDEKDPSTRIRGGTTGRVSAPHDDSSTSNSSSTHSLSSSKSNQSDVSSTTETSFTHERCLMEENFNPQYLTRFLEGLVYMCPTHKRKSSLESRMGKLTPWICANVWLFSLSELVLTNRYLADLGYSEPGYYEVFIPFLSQRVHAMTREDVRNTVDCFNKLRFTDDMLGGRQFFYRLGKQWQTLYAKSMQEKAIAKKRSLNKRGEVVQRHG
ncbi:unnamed protein product [Amoebophrya sp. A25]|nr:unnamed protein product [Amoebophrya sp. A25]|eukprot:GSA25T00015178001.1